MPHSKTIPGWLLALACLAGIGSLSAQDDDGGATGLGGAVGDDAIALMFPIGKPWTHVRVPKYDANDVLDSILLAETLTRNDEQLLLMEDLTIVMLEADGTLQLRLKTDRAIYDLTSEKMKSRTRTFIQHQKFDMYGDTMDFNTKTQKGKLNGNVEMIIFDMESGALPFPGTSFSGGAEPEAPGPEEGSEAKIDSESATNETREEKP